MSWSLNGPEVAAKENCYCSLFSFLKLSLCEKESRWFGDGEKDIISPLLTFKIYLGEEQ